MYDQRLRPLADRYKTSHGLPSLETHMATMVTGWWVETGGGPSDIPTKGEVGGVDGVIGGEDWRPLIRLLAVGYICFVGFTRWV